MSYSPTNPRFCHQCRLAKRECACHLMQKFELPIKIWLWQDPKEKKRKNNTGFWLTCLLTHLEFSDDNDEIPLEWIHVIKQNLDCFAVLFPTSESQSVSQEVAQSVKNLIVLDTTWDKARSVVQRNPILSQIQTLHLEGLRGQFDIRKPPFLGAVSTVESVAHFFRLANLSSQLDMTVQKVIEHRLKSWQMQLTKHKK